MTRRNFVGIVILGIIALLAGLSTIVFRGFEKTVEKFIKADLAHLTLSQEIIDKYIADGKEMNIWKKYDFSKIQFIKAHSLVSNKYFKLPYFEKYIQYRSEIIGNFLLSTDFFINKMDESKSLNYKTLYNPYFTPCANPFSNIHYN